ncbi:MAG: hypothetical protein QW250_08060, partial [Sulfolobaceae archaeon]
PLPTSVISQITGINKKSIIDSIGKLSKKGLIEKRNNHYALTKEGIELVKTIEDLLNSTLNFQSREVMKQNNEFDPTHYYYLLEFLKASLLNGGIIPIKVLSLESGISTRTIKNYLEIFTNKYNFFRKISKKRRFFGNIIHEYVLTEDAMKFINKIPELLRLKNSKSLKLISKITKSSKLETALLKILALQGLCEITILSLARDLMIYCVVLLNIINLLIILAYIKR